MNIPNRLTLLRIFLIPLCMFFIVFTGMPETACRLIAAGLFILTSLTDMLDGKLARKWNQVTNFGKFLDPVADKLLIIGSYLAILMRYRSDALFVQIMGWSLFVIIAREIAVTSLRMMASGSVVIAANWLGKCKTVSQMVCVIVVLLEPVLFPGLHYIPSMILILFSALMTVLSGISYFKAYWKFINPKQ